MKFEVIGFVKRADLKNNLIDFSPMGLRKTLKLDIFTGNKKFSWIKDDGIKKLILKCIEQEKSRFNAIGYCYNSHTLISNIIVFEREEELNRIVKEAWEKENEG